MPVTNRKLINIWSLFPALWLSLLTSTLAVDPPATCDNKADVIFVIDGSEHVMSMDFKKVIDFVDGILNHLGNIPKDVNIGVVVYSSRIGGVIEMNKTKATIRAEMSKLAPPGEGANAHKGIAKARDMLTSSNHNATQVIVVITGSRSSSPPATVQEANAAKAKGITMMAIGVGGSTYPAELQLLVSDSGYLLSVKKYSELSSLHETLGKQICSVTTEPTTTTQTTTQTTTTPTTTQTTTSTTATTTAPLVPDCKSPRDILLLIGASSLSNWRSKVTVLKMLIANLNITEQGVHVGIVAYASLKNRILNLSPFRNATNLTTTLAVFKPAGGGGNIGLGLKEARGHFVSHGRQNIPKVAVVITDRPSSDPVATASEAAGAKSEGVKVMALGLGRRHNASELTGLVSSRELYLKILSFASFKNLLYKISDTICTWEPKSTTSTTQVTPTTSTIPTTSTTSTLASTSTTLTTTTSSTATTTILPETTTTTPGSPCSVPADVLFLLDGSDSISRHDWSSEVALVSELLDKLDVQPSGVKVGVIVLRSIVGDKLSFNQSKETLRSLLHTLEHPSFDQNTAEGIAKARQMFQNEGRPNTHKIAVIITNSKYEQPSQIISEANLAKNEGVHMIAVDVGNRTTDAVLNGIATSKKDVFKVSDFDDLRVTKKVETHIHNLCEDLKTKKAQVIE